MILQTTETFSHTIAVRDQEVNVAFRLKSVLFYSLL
jgi:hypothetical protein